MQKFEYKCIQIWGGAEKTTLVLNEYGAQGWELVFVVNGLLYLKRTIG